MEIASPVSFREAVRILDAKKLMPTDLTSAQLRALESGIRQSSFYSAQTQLTDLLDNYKRGVQSIVAPAQVIREGAAFPVTEGFNPASLRTFIKQYLQSISYTPEEGKRGGLQDLSSNARISLVIDTNVRMAQGAGHFIQQNDPGVVEAWPALEFIRVEDRDKERDWATRWRNACEVAGDATAMGVFGRTGRMAALKSSGVWQALGDGAGGYTDTLGNPFDPIAFSTGMGQEEIDREEAVELGLLKDGDEPEPAKFDFASLFGLGKEAA